MHHKVLSHKDSFNIVFDKLKSGLPLSFVRFGDGDHIIMYKQSLNKVVGGGNRFIVTENLQKEITECYNIQDRDFLVGTMLNDRSKRQMAKTETRIDKTKLPLLVERDEMLAMSCLFETFMNDMDSFAAFLREMKKTSTLFVGSYYHPRIYNAYGEGRYINVTPINCYSNIHDWYPQILRNIHRVDKIVISAGFCGRVIAKRLWKLGVRMPVIDVGSLSDIFIFHEPDITTRINRRSFMTKIEKDIGAKVKELMKMI